MIKLKPFNIMDSRLFRPERAAVVSAIEETLIWAGHPIMLSINDFGRWRHPQWRNSAGELVPYLSVDWYVDSAYDSDRKQVCVEDFLESVLHEPWRDASLLGDHYDVFLLDADMFLRLSESAGRHLVEAADSRLGIVISLSRLQGLQTLSYPLLKTAAMRALARLFGVPSIQRKDVGFDDVLYCTNACIMGRATVAPRDWEAMTELRLAATPFCASCLADLRAFVGQLDEAASS